MDALLHLVQRAGDRAEPQPAQAPLYCTKCNSPPIISQCTNHRMYCCILVCCSAVLMCPWRLNRSKPHRTICSYPPDNHHNLTYCLSDGEQWYGYNYWCDLTTTFWSRLEMQTGNTSFPCKVMALLNCIWLVHRGPKNCTLFILLHFQQIQANSTKNYSLPKLARFLRYSV